MKVLATVTGRRGTRVLLIAAAALCSMLLIAAVSAQSSDYCRDLDANAACTYTGTAEETEFYGFLNPVRTHFGADALVGVAELREAAKMHGAYLVVENKMQHHEDNPAPFGASPLDRAQRANYAGVNNGVGENITTAGEPESSFMSWAGSFGHCTNMLNARYRDSGYAVVSGDGRDRAVHVLGGGGSGTETSQAATAFCCMMSPQLTDVTTFATKVLVDDKYADFGAECMALSGTSFTFPPLPGDDSRVGTQQTYTMPADLQTLLTSTQGTLEVRAQDVLAGALGGTAADIDPAVVELLRTMNTCTVQDGGQPFQINVGLQVFGQRVQVQGTPPDEVIDAVQTTFDTWPSYYPLLPYGGSASAFVAQQYGFGQAVSGEVGMIYIGGDQVQVLIVSDARFLTGADAVLFTGIEQGPDPEVNCAALRRGITPDSGSAFPHNSSIVEGEFEFVPLGAEQGTLTFTISATSGNLDVLMGIYRYSDQAYLTWNPTTRQFDETLSYATSHTMELAQGNDLALMIWARSGSGSFTITAQ